MKNLEVFVNKAKAGVLAKEADTFVFSYESDAKDLVSVTMPIRTQSWNSNRLHPIFEMNLPEGALKDSIKERFSKLTEMDDLGMLHLVGAYVIGRVKYAKVKESEEVTTLDDILNSEAEELFESLMDKFAIRSGISGVQPKILLDMYDKSTLTTEHYIVKSWTSEYPELALNEFFCMEAVRFSGLEVPKYYLSKNRSMFVMKRFDLKDDGSFYGFEDGCVLLGKSTEEKYNASYEDLAKAIKASVRPQMRKKALHSLFKAIIMNHLLRNGDGHLKNYGILYENDYTDAVLAPIYDVVCTTVYIKKDIPALRMSAGKLWFKEKTYRIFAKQTCQMSTKEIDETLQICANAVKKTTTALDEYVKNNRDIELFANELKSEWQKASSL